MADAVRVQVVEAHQNLFEVKSANCWAKGSSVRYEVKKLAALNQLLGDVGDMGLAAILVRIYGVLFEAVVFNQGWMVQFTCLFNLSLAKLEELCVEVGLVFLEDLERNFTAIGMDCFLDFGAEAGPKGAANSEVVDCWCY